MRNIRRQIRRLVEDVLPFKRPTPDARQVPLTGINKSGEPNIVSAFKSYSSGAMPAFHQYGVGGKIRVHVKGVGHLKSDAGDPLEFDTVEDAYNGFLDWKSGQEGLKGPHKVLPFPQS